MEPAVKTVAEQERELLKALASKRTHSIAGPISDARDVTCQVQIAGRDIQPGDIERIHEYVRLLAKAFEQERNGDDPR
ncbi:MAG: hypothetical protein ACRD9L_15200 [Bryobacteraceae bacterium]